MQFIYFDTEDNSPELAKAGKSMFDKKIVQIAAYGPNGKEFYWSGKSKGGKPSAEGARQFLSWAQSFNDPALSVYAHNIKYDLAALFADELDALDLTMVGTRVIRARYQNLVFKDSFNLWPMSLKRIGKAVGIEKKDLDVHSKDYVFNDCAIGRKAIQVAWKLASRYGLDHLPATLGGLCVKLWQKMDGANWHCGIDWCRKAYYGGRVELFNQGGKGNIFYCDINSLYPSMMCQAYPDDFEERDSLLGWGIARVKIRIPKCSIAPLPVEREDGSIYYPWGIIDGRDSTMSGEGRNGVWTFHEIKNAVEHGAEVLELYEAWGSEYASFYYRDFIKEFYRLRKETDDEGLKLFYKLLMNNLYGQLAQTGVVTRAVPLDKCVERDDHDEPILDINGDALLKRDGVPYGQKLLTNLQMPLPIHVNILHGAYITSYARLALQKYLRSIDDKSLIYCDTDSVFFFHDQDKPPFPISKELGEMKLEAQCTECIAYGPKMYSLTMDGKRSFKAKGVPNKTLEGEKRSLPQKYIEDGQAEYMLPFNMRESIHYYNDWKKNGVNGKSRRLGVWRNVTKRRLSEYDKKDFKGGYFFPKKHLT